MNTYNSLKSRGIRPRSTAVFRKVQSQSQLTKYQAETGIKDKESKRHSINIFSLQERKSKRIMEENQKNQEPVNKKENLLLQRFYFKPKMSKEMSSNKTEISLSDENSVSNQINSKSYTNKIESLFQDRTEEKTLKKSKSGFLGELLMRNLNGFERRETNSARDSLNGSSNPRSILKRYKVNKMKRVMFDETKNEVKVVSKWINNINPLNFPIETQKSLEIDRSLFTTNSFSERKYSRSISRLL